jgi:hypothetical protein
MRNDAAAYLAIASCDVKPTPAMAPTSLDA